MDAGKPAVAWDGSLLYFLWATVLRGGKARAVLVAGLERAD